MPINDNKRIAKNTLFLYIRMALIMLTTLYISRIILRILGVEDFGIYNVIAGFVSMFAFITATVSGGTSRFFAFEIGRDNNEKLSQYFRLSIMSFGLLSLIILLFAETIGLWFIKNRLVIPDDRLSAGIVVYHFSVCSLIINMFSIPYKSLIIAKEKMGIYAYISIIEVVINLIIVFVLDSITMDKLKLYSILLFVLNLIIAFSFFCCCRLLYRESRFSFFWNRGMFVEFFNYSCWIVIGTLSGILRGQGLNVILNIFFGPTVNAARGIAFQVHSAINQFVNNFYMACRPQITKLYAAGDHCRMMNLVFSSSRICYLLTLLLTLPILIETPHILKLWLSIVPDHTIFFTRLVLMTILIETISYPFQAAVSATGKVKWYQIITGGITLLTLPIAYVFLKYGYRPEVVFYISIIMAIVAQASRLLFMKMLLQLSVISYLRQVIARMIMVSVLSTTLPVVLNYYLNESFTSALFVVFASLLSVLFWGFMCGISKEERRSVVRMLKKIYVRKEN